MIISKLDSTHFVITYSKDTAGARDQRLVAGEVSGTSITLGSSTSIHNANRAAYNALTQLDSTRFVVTHTTSTGVAYAIVGTVTGTSIGTGSKVQFANPGSSPRMAAMDSTHVVFTFRANAPTNNIYWTIGTISDMSISFGSTTELFTEGTLDETLALAKIDSTHLALIYGNTDSSSKGTARVLAYDGSIVAPDSAVEFNAETISSYTDLAIVSENTIAIIYRNNSSIGYAVIGSLPTTSSSSSTTNKRSNSLSQLRLQNGLDAHGYALSSSSSSSSSSSVSSSAQSSSSSSSSVSSTLSTSSSSSSSRSVAANHSAASVNPLKDRTCERVMKWFGNVKMLERVNERLQKRFGFICAQ